MTSAPQRRGRRRSARLPPAGRTAAELLAVIAGQLGSPPRGAFTVAHRCPCGLPDVIQTAAPAARTARRSRRLYYLTCPRAGAAVSRLEAAGVMREMTRRLAGG